MIKLTVDTNVVQDYADSARKFHRYAVQLVKLDHERQCDIRVVSRFLNDVPNEPLRSKLAALEICQRPLIPTLAEWDVSAWAVDIWATDEQAAEFDQLFDLIFPGAVASHSKQPSRRSDVGHLIGHKIEGRDVFVSNDSAFLGQAIALQKRFGLTVMSSPDAASYVNAKAVAR